jgi:hypothetical protein
MLAHRPYNLVSHLSVMDNEALFCCEYRKLSVVIIIIVIATDLGHPYRIYIIPTHDKHQWLLIQFLVLLMMDVESIRNM